MAKQALPSTQYQIMSVTLSDPSLCAYQCSFKVSRNSYTNWVTPVTTVTPRRLQVPTCDSFQYTNTTNTCTLSYTRYSEGNYATNADVNLIWLEQVNY